MADLCERVGADVQQVATAIGADGRIGDKFLHPGPGYGGSCFPKDVSALIRIARESKAPLSLIEQVQTINDERKIAMATRIHETLDGDLRGKKIAVWGVTFKPNTDDMREAPSLVIVPTLLDRGAEVVAYDPQGQANATPLLQGVQWGKSAMAAADGADAVVVLTEWNEFRAVNLTDLKAAMRGTTLIDLRNIFAPSDARARGFDYSSVGRA